MERESDIDRNAELLVELLYGERDAESADLDDDARAELESLGELRALFRAMPDEEPPNAVTAKLMALAAQHAPKAKPEQAEETGGFFAWFTGLFKPIMMHPGLAAAASLVLVAGVAGALYVTGRGDVAQPGRASSSGAVSEKSVRMPATEQDEKRNFAADSPDPVGDESAELGLSETAAAAPMDGVRSDEADKQAVKKKAKPARSPTPAPKSRVRATRIEGVVGGNVIPAKPSPEPKKKPDLRDLNKDRADPKPPPADPSPDTAADDDAAFGDAEGEEAAPSGKGGARARAPSQAKQKEEKESASTRQAKKLHGSAAAAAARNDCKKALSYGNKIRKINSRYYDDVFLSDNRIRKCRAARKKK